MATLYLIPCPISDDTAVADVTPAANQAIIDSLDYFIVENTRSARRFLSKSGYARAIDDATFVELNEHTTSPTEIAAMIKPLLEGRNAGVISEAGVPAVADPGQAVVELCHKHNIKVVPLVGPSSILMAVMASGLSALALWIICRDLRSLMAVTVQVLITYTSATSSKGTIPNPADAKSSAIASVSYWLTLQPKVWKATVLIIYQTPAIICP